MWSPMWVSAKTVCFVLTSQDWYVCLRLAQWRRDLDGFVGGVGRDCVLRSGCLVVLKPEK